MKALARAIGLVVIAASSAMAAGGPPSFSAQVGNPAIVKSVELTWLRLSADTAVLRFPRDDDGAYRFACDGAGVKCLPIEAVVAHIKAHGTERER